MKFSKKDSSSDTKLVAVIVVWRNSDPHSESCKKQRGETRHAYDQRTSHPIINLINNRKKFQISC